MNEKIYEKDLIAQTTLVKGRCRELILALAGAGKITRLKDGEANGKIYFTPEEAKIVEDEFKEELKRRAEAERSGITKDSRKSTTTAEPGRPAPQPRKEAKSLEDLARIEGPTKTKELPDKKKEKEPGKPKESKASALELVRKYWVLPAMLVAFILVRKWQEARTEARLQQEKDPRGTNAAMQSQAQPEPNKWLNQFKGV